MRNQIDGNPWGFFTKFCYNSNWGWFISWGSFLNWSYLKPILPHKLNLSKEQITLPHKHSLQPKPKQQHKFRLASQAKATSQAAATILRPHEKSILSTFLSCLIISYMGVNAYSNWDTQKTLHLCLRNQTTFLGAKAPLGLAMVVSVSVMSVTKRVSKLQDLASYDKLWPILTNYD